MNKEKHQKLRIFLVGGGGGLVKGFLDSVNEIYSILFFPLLPLSAQFLCNFFLVQNFYGVFIVFHSKLYFYVRIAETDNYK